MSVFDPTQDLLTQNEAAKLAGLTKGGFRYLKLRDLTPKPVLVAGRELYLRAEIEEWAAERAARRP